jgi:hypothetical protein
MKNTKSITMRKKMPSLLFTLLLLGHIVYAQYPRGKVVFDHLYSASLENQGGENPTRRVTIYLPPGYEKGKQRYPVIYYLHGFTWSDSMMIAGDHFDKLLDKAIAIGKIKPVIVVMPDHHTLYRGSYITNSSFTGKWADFTGIDLVNFIDKKYRTIPEWESRGISGHSMGGQGAIKMGMLFPEVFSSVYALSPATVAIVEDIGIKSNAFKRVQEIKSREELITDFLPNTLVAMGRTYSPNPNKPPFYADLPYRYEKDSLIVEYKVLELWNKNSVIGMVDKHIEDLRKLRALKLDWGRNEEFTHIPVSCKIFSQMLENLGVEHYAEEYFGAHSNKLWTDDGRALNEMLPFFDTYLKFK